MASFLSSVDRKRLQVQCSVKLALNWYVRVEGRNTSSSCVTCENDESWRVQQGTLVLQNTKKTPREWWASYWSPVHFEQFSSISGFFRSFLSLASSPEWSGAVPRSSPQASPLPSSPQWRRRPKQLVAGRPGNGSACPEGSGSKRWWPWKHLKLKKLTITKAGWIKRTSCKHLIFWC